MQQQLVPVDSSMIQAMAYDAAARQLTIQFRTNGAIWEYDDVPPSIYQALRYSDSIGKTFTTQVKGKFTGRQV